MSSKQLQHVHCLRGQRKTSFDQFQESSFPAPEQSGRRTHSDSGFRGSSESGETDDDRMVILRTAEIQAKFLHIFFMGAQGRRQRRIRKVKVGAP